MGFFYCNERGVYQSLQATDGIIRSRALAGFQFRVADLLNCPELSELMHDAVYQPFVFKAWQADKQRAADAEAEVVRLQALLEAQKSRNIS